MGYALRINIIKGLISIKSRKKDNILKKLLSYLNVIVRNLVDF